MLVGVIDTGIDGTHPDIAPNFNRALSRNFVTDIPDTTATVDGPCEFSGCKDPVDQDDDGHGTHVASTIGSPLNGLGIAGVAPGVSLVNIRAGQDSGFFFLKPSLDALTYAADIGIDVVNMSYYVDPWLFNCAHNKADSRTAAGAARDHHRHAARTRLRAQAGRHTHHRARQRLHRPRQAQGRRDQSRLPARQRTRKVDNSCINVPAESKGVISVSAVGPSGRKAYYSDYGIEQADLSRPAATSTTAQGPSTSPGRPGRRPRGSCSAARTALPSGEPQTPSVVRDCQNGPAPTTSISTAPRWRPRTPPASPPS